jgi:hypothetical protein
MTLLTTYKKYGNLIMDIFRLDLQVHFFWGFFLTLGGIYWTPLFYAGFVVTIIKEALDLWSKGHWSWGDFWWGIGGSLIALALAKEHQPCL